MKNMLRKTLSLFLLSILITACSSEELSIKDAWVQPGVAGGNSALYFSLQNSTGNEVVLKSVSSAEVEAVEIHETMQGADGTMSMQLQGTVAISAGESVQFEPGGLHVMLIGLKENLKVGDSIHVVFHFSGRDDVDFDVPVKEGY
jgi:copper(I)-binding protein